MAVEALGEALLGDGMAEQPPTATQRALALKVCPEPRRLHIIGTVSRSFKFIPLAQRPLRVRLSSPRFTVRRRALMLLHASSSSLSRSWRVSHRVRHQVRHSYSCGTSRVCFAVRMDRCSGAIVIISCGFDAKLGRFAASPGLPP